MQVRTRFAPSPTGYLHVGSARTALYAWLYARKHGGKFILRIENTDVERSSKESIQAILDGMDWLGLDYDEGPFYQSERMNRYKELIQKLLDDGLAYRCYCSKERLEDLRKKQLGKKQKPRYDGLCRLRDPSDPNQPYVVRFKNPQEGEVSFDDQVHGKITFQNNELDDLIIARSNGMPTYNFAVAIDDLDMKITHVIRGDDHINNTPRQINVIKALGFEPPVYAHLPMILGSDGARLSKRHGAVSVMQYRDDGFMPHALLNYLVRLGWSHGDQEIFSVKDMTKFFELNKVHKAPAAFNTDKLLWLNQHYLKTDDPKKVADRLKWYMADTSKGPELDRVVQIQAERSHTLKEMAEKSRCFYEDFAEYDNNAKKQLKGKVIPVLQEIKDGFQNLTDWRAEVIHEIIISTAEKFELKLGKVAQPIRAAITGGTISPPIDVTAELIGKQRVIERLEKAIAVCSA